MESNGFVGQLLGSIVQNWVWVLLVLVWGAVVGYLKAVVTPYSQYTELDQLKTDIASWEQRVLNYMEKSGLPPTKISNFRVLGLYANRVKGGYNSEHARELGMLLERLDRLLYMALEMEGPALNPSS